MWLWGGGVLGTHNWAARRVSFSAKAERAAGAGTCRVASEVRYTRVTPVSGSRPEEAAACGDAGAGSIAVGRGGREWAAMD